MCCGAKRGDNHQVVEEASWALLLFGNFWEPFGSARVLGRWGTFPKEQKKHGNWPFGNFHCTFTAGLDYHWTLVSHQPFLWRRPAISYIETGQLLRKYLVFLTPTSKGSNDQLWLISWRATVKDRVNETEMARYWITRSTGFVVRVVWMFNELIIPYFVTISNQQSCDCPIIT